MTAHLVYLVRHGKAEPHRDDDAGRRLTREGRAAVEAHARALLAELRVRRIVTSPFARARETAELLSAATGAPMEEDEALASGASSGRALLARVRREAAGTALVGHNPELAEALALAAGHDVELKPGAVAALAVERGEATIRWVRTPEPR